MSKPRYRGRKQVFELNSNRAPLYKITTGPIQGAHVAVNVYGGTHEDFMKVITPGEVRPGTGLGPSTGHQDKVQVTDSQRSIPVVGTQVVTTSLDSLYLSEWLSFL